MKKYLVFILLITGSFLASADDDEIVNTCTASDSKKACKKELGDYSYDASKTTRIKFINKPMLKELEVPLYIGEKYKFIFNKEGLPQDIDIEVWNHPYENKRKELLFSSRDYQDQDIIVWEPEKSRKVFLVYKIPPTADVEKQGCVVFVIGYLAKHGDNH